MAGTTVQTRGATTRAFIEQLAYGHKPEYLMGLVLKHGGEISQRWKDFLSINYFMNRWTQVDNIETVHFEKDWFWKSIKVSAAGAVAGAAGAPVTFTVHTDDHNTATGLCDVRLNDVIEFPGRVRARVSAVTTTANANQVTVIPMTAAQNIPTIAGSQKLFRTDNNYEEYTGGRDSITTLWSHVTHTHQIIKGAYKISGTEMATKLYEIGGAAYQEFRGREEEVERVKTASLHACLLGQANVDNLNTGSREMLGLIPFIMDRGGITHQYPVGAFGIQDLKDIIALIDAEKVGDNRDYMLWMGLQPSFQFDDMIKTEFQQGINYGAFPSYAGKPPQEIAVTFGFKAFQLGNYNFFKNLLGEFTNPETMGNSTLNYSNMILGLPMGNTAAGEKGEKLPMLEWTYLGRPGYSRFWEEFELGSADMSNGASTDLDTKEYHIRREIGSRLKCANAFFAAHT